MILIVTRRRDLFVLHECSGPEPVSLVAVQSDNAQGIQDYAEAMFPAGTVIHSCVLPTNSRPLRRILTLRAAVWAWLVKIPSEQWLERVA